MTLPEAIEQLEAAAWRVARRRFAADALRPGELARRAVELSRIYTVEREAGAAVMATAEHLPARLLFFTISELAKWVAPLAELGLAAGGTRFAALEVLDLGAGCGAAGLGLLAFCATGAASSVRLHAMDRDEAALELLAAVTDELGSQPGWPALELRSSRHDLGRSLPDGARPFDLVLAGNLLNELPAGRSRELVRQALAQLAPGGKLVVIEPALRSTSRALHALRDELLLEGSAAVLLPCTRTGPCPALLGPDDWCHQSRGWTPPPSLQQLGTLSGLRRRELRFSLLAMARPDAARARRPGAWRVVSEPLVSKGKREFFLCGEAGRLRAVLLNRHRSPRNDPFRDLRRGQLCWIEGAERRGPELRLSAESRVEADVT